MNEIYGKMRKKAMSRIWLGLIFIVLGAVFIVCNQNLLGYLTAKENAFNVETSAFQSVASGNSTIPKVYSFEGNMFLDWYGSDDEGYYYIMPTIDKKFMGCFVYNKDKATADQIVEEYQNYLTTDGASEPATFITGKGYVYDMGSTEKQYFKEYMVDFCNAAGITNAEDYLVYKTFVIAPMGEVVSGSEWFMAVLAIVFLVGGLWYFISFFTGSYKSQPKKYIATYGISESELASDLTYAIHKKNMDIGRQYAMCYGQSSYLIPYSQLLWTYVHITKTRHRTNGIPTGTTYTYQVFFAMRDKSKYNVVVKSEAEGQEIVKDVCEMAPHVIGGYHEDLDKMFNKNVNEVIQIVEEHKAELARKAAGEDDAAEGYTPPESVSMSSFSLNGSDEAAATQADTTNSESGNQFEDGFDPANYSGSSQGSGLDADTFGKSSGSSSSFKLKDE